MSHVGGVVGIECFVAPAIDAYAEIEEFGIINGCVFDAEAMLLNCVFPIDFRGLGRNAGVGPERIVMRGGALMGWHVIASQSSVGDRGLGHDA